MNVLGEVYNYNKFCHDSGCSEFIEWTFYEDDSESLKSCKKIGQSDNIDKYPSDCNFLADIKKINILKD